jgi:hypothetical protein
LTSTATVEHGGWPCRSGRSGRNPSDARPERHSTGERYT